MKKSVVTFRHLTSLVSCGFLFRLFNLSLFFILLNLAAVSQSLTDAVQSQDSAVVQQLLSSGEDVNQTNADGLTPLLIASQLGNYEIALLLLENHADVNKADTNGVSPLIASSERGYVSLVELFIDKGADVRYQDNNQMNAYDHCMEADWKDSPYGSSEEDFRQISSILRSKLNP